MCCVVGGSKCCLLASALGWYVGIIRDVFSVNCNKQRGLPNESLNTKNYCCTSRSSLTVEHPCRPLLTLSFHRVASWGKNPLMSKSDAYRRLRSASVCCGVVCGVVPRPPGVLPPAGLFLEYPLACIAKQCFETLHSTIIEFLKT